MLKMTLKKLFAGGLLLGLMGFSFSSAHAEQLIMVGGQRDQHGCLSPAGYQWSNLLSQCIRIWETGEKVADSGNPVEWAGSYAVFSQDGNQVELFLVDQKKAPILQKQGEIYTNIDFRLQQQNNGWQLIRLDRKHQSHQK